jgi:hypothetical protein
VQVDQGTTEWFTIQKGVRQGCILSPGLFNLYSEYIIKTGGVGDMVTGTGKVAQKINTITHAVDTTLLDESKDDTIELIKMSQKNGERISI